jgi:hypothetical protein
MLINKPISIVHKTRWASDDHAEQIAAAAILYGAGTESRSRATLLVIELHISRRSYWHTILNSQIVSNWAITTSAQATSLKSLNIY